MREWSSLQGSAHLFSDLQADLGKHMQKFEQTAVRTSLRVPPGLLHPSSLPHAEAPPCTPEDEQSADSQLAQLRQRIEQVCRPVASIVPWTICSFRSFVWQKYHLQHPPLWGLA